MVDVWITKLASGLPSGLVWYTWGSLKIGDRQVTMGFNTGLIGMLWKLPYTQWPCKRNSNWGYLPYMRPM